MTYKGLTTKKFLQLHAKLVLKVAVVLCCAIFSACSTSVIEFEKKDLAITNLDGKTIPITVELARSRREMTKGFMGRTNIPDGTGMLFVFKKDRLLDERHAYAPFNRVHQCKWRNMRNTRYDAVQ